MQIHVAHLVKEGPQSYRGEEPAEILDLEADPYLRPVGPVQYDLMAEVVGHELLVRGRVAAPLETPCSRCGEICSTRVEDSSFLRAYEITAEVDSVNLDGDLREAILLKCPNFPLCLPDCRGLCPQCGANLNRGPCACRPPDWQATWGQLDGLEL